MLMNFVHSTLELMENWQLIDSIVRKFFVGSMAESVIEVLPPFVVCRQNKDAT